MSRGARGGRKAGVQSATPTRYRSDTQDLLVAALSSGHTHTAAAALVGVTPRTLKNWLSQGRSELERGITETPLAQLAHALDVAEASAQGALERSLIECLQDADLPVEARMRGIERFLRQRYPHDWGDSGAVRVQRALESMLDDVRPLLSELAWRELAVAISRVNDSAPLSAKNPDKTED